MQLLQDWHTLLGDHYGVRTQAECFGRLAVLWEVEFDKRITFLRMQVLHMMKEHY